MKRTSRIRVIIAEDHHLPSAQLTPREREVLQLVSEGRTNAAIAEAMKISVKTVEKHRPNVTAKLNPLSTPSGI